VALKKPTDLFDTKDTSGVFKAPEVSSHITESYNKFVNNFETINELSLKVDDLSQQLSGKLDRTDLENAMLSQLLVLDENFKNLQNEVKGLNKKDLKEFKETVYNLTEIIDNLLETELPKYKKQVSKNQIFTESKVNQLKEFVETNVDVINKEVDNKFENIADVVDNNIQYFNLQLQETSSQVKKTTETYTNLSKIVESRISKENEQLEQYSQVIEDIQKSFIELQQVLDERVSVSQEIIEEKFVEYQEQTEEKINHHQKEFKDTQIKLERSVNNRLENYRQELVDVKADVVINEQHIKKVDKYLQEHHQELIELKEEVFDEIEKLPVGNLQENIERLEKKIDFIKETYSRIEPEVIVKEVIKEGLLNEPPNVKNGDPLTPLNQNFVTLDQLQQHYRLFLNRIQQQLSTLGGGGETQLKYLDDIVGIATNASAYDGKYLRYNHSSGKFEFEVAQVTPDSIVLGTDTTGDYVQSISGTANQITVSGGTGESSTPVVSIAPNPLLPGNVTIANDLQVNNNLNVTGNITIGGTSAYIISNDFRVKDADIVLGFTTSNNGADVSNDTTANHGGIAIASTEGTPLVQLYNPAIGETNPVTYKKIMWFKSGAFAGLNTDAWLINYAVGIGSTQFPSGTRLAVGAVQFTERDLAVVRNINASGVVTATTFSGNLTGNVTGNLNSSGVNTAITISGTTATYTTGNFTTGNIVTGVVTSISGTNLNYSGVSTVGSLNIGATQVISSGRQLQNIASLDATTTATIESAIANAPNTFTDIQVTGVSTFTNGPVLIGSATSTGTATQRLQVTGGAYVSSNTGIGTTNPQALLSIGSVSGFQDTTTTLATTTATTIDSFSATVFRSARIQVQISQSTNYQASDVLVIHDGTTASIVEYGSIATNDYIGTLNATVSGGNCLLRVTMVSATSATVKVLSQRITI